jgi:hypothetical protein
MTKTGTMTTLPTLSAVLHPLLPAAALITRAMIAWDASLAEDEIGPGLVALYGPHEHGPLHDANTALTQWMETFARAAEIQALRIRIDLPLETPPADDVIDVGCLGEDLRRELYARLSPATWQDGGVLVQYWYGGPNVFAAVPEAAREMQAEHFPRLTKAGVATRMPDENIALIATPAVRLWFARFSAKMTPIHAFSFSIYVAAPSAHERLKALHTA